MADIKTLRVCLAKDLPTMDKRDSNFIYFLYDKLMIFVGQSLYNDPYIITENIPQFPLSSILYFCLSDGKVKTYSDSQVIDIAVIESEDQLDILKQSGTMFFSNSNRRYLDINRRIIILPYQNGTYELTLSLANDIKIDKDTVIGFNTESNMFEIIGSREDFDLNFLNEYEGKETNTIKNTIEDFKISSNVKISGAYNNIIKLLDDGLYADNDSKVNKEVYNKFVAGFNKYKEDMDLYLRELESKIQEVSDSGRVVSLNEKIREALMEVYPKIDEALETFDELYSKFDDIEHNLKKYADEKFDKSYLDLMNAINDAASNPWADFSTIVGI